MHGFHLLSPRQAQTTAVPFLSIMPHHFKQVAIIGVGLIGGSLGLVLKHAHRRYHRRRVAGELKISRRRLK